VIYFSSSYSRISILKKYINMYVAGEVVFADVLSYAGGRSKGCGIVEYATASEAANAISTLNDTERNERPLLIPSG
jgi:RNA recognition motif-containing protein